MDLKKFINRLFNLIGNDKIEIAIQEMSALLKNSDLLDDLTMQNARFKSIKKQIRNGIVDFNEANIELNQIRYALIEIARELEDLSLEKTSVKTILEGIPDDFAKNLVQNTISQEGNNNNSINISGIISGDGMEITINQKE